MTHFLFVVSVTFSKGALVVLFVFQVTLVLVLVLQVIYKLTSLAKPIFTVLPGLFHTDLGTPLFSDAAKLAKFIQVSNNGYKLVLSVRFHCTTHTEN